MRGPIARGVSFVCLSPVTHEGRTYPVDAVLPEDVPTERLLGLGVIEERKPPKPRPKAKTAAGAGERE